MPKHNDNPETAGSGKRNSQKAISLGGWSVRIASHALGVACIAALLLVPYIDQATLELIMASAQHAEFVQLTALEVALHMGLAACLWALVVILFEIVTARREPVSKLLNLERGSVMTETLVILPVFFLLTFGIAQLAVNNIAGLMANTAVFQAGRTVWLWSSEAEENRRGVTNAMVKSMAHAQAAAVLTPVAPGEFIQSTGGGDQQFEQMRGALLGSQLPSFSSDTGQTAMSLADGMLLGENLTNTSSDTAFFRAFDTSDWRRRSVRKFTFAHNASEITVVDTGDRIGARLVYNHHQAFPMVGILFGEPKPNLGGRAGFYAVLEREFTMPKQIPPNPNTP
jgi:hypothetical protein